MRFEEIYTRAVDERNMTEQQQYKLIYDDIKKYNEKIFLLEGKVEKLKSINNLNQVHFLQSEEYNEMKEEIDKLKKENQMLLRQSTETLDLYKAENIKNQGLSRKIKKMYKFCLKLEYQSTDLQDNEEASNEKIQSLTQLLSETLVDNQKLKEQIDKLNRDYLKQIETLTMKILELSSSNNKLQKDLSDVKQQFEEIDYDTQFVQAKATFIVKREKSQLITEQQPRSTLPFKKQDVSNKKANSKSEISLQNANSQTEEEEKSPFKSEKNEKKQKEKDSSSKSLKIKRSIFGKYFSSNKNNANDMSVEEEIKDDFQQHFESIPVKYSCDLLPTNLLESIQAHEKNSQCMAFNCNGSLLITCGDSGLKSWNTESWTNSFTSQAFSKSINNIAFSRSSPDLFAIASLDFQVRVMKINSLRQTQSVIHGHSDVINQLCFTYGGLLISASVDRNIKVWDTQTGKTVDRIYATSICNSCDINLSDKMIVTGHQDSKVRLYSPNGQIIKELSFHDDVVTSVQFSPTNYNEILTCSKDNTLRVIDIRTYQQLQVLEDPSLTISSNLKACFSAGGKLALTASSNDSIIAFDLIRGDVAGVIKDKGNRRSTVVNKSNVVRISDIAWQNRGDKLATLNSDGILNIWN